MDLEQGTASSGRVPPSLADDNDCRASGVGSMGVTFLPPSRTDCRVSSPDLAGWLPGNMRFTFFQNPVVTLCDTVFCFPDTSAAGAYHPSGPGGPPSFNRQAPQTPSDD